MKRLTILSGVAIALLLSACSQLSFNTAQMPAGKDTVKLQEQENSELKVLREKVKTLPSFIFATEKQTATAYFEGQQPALIEVKTNSDIENIVLQNGRVVAVQKDKNYYDFRNDKVAKEQNRIKTAAEKWVRLLGYNSADKNIATVRTGDEAKLNYLCIAKLQQVAETKKVLRTSVNKAQSTSRLTASMRLNGKQFYLMDCVLSGDRVAKLNLMAK